MAGNKIRFNSLTLIFLYSDTFSTTLMPLKPFPLPSNNEPSFEIIEFSGNADREMYPYTTFANHLFVYPLMLTFDSQKLFSRARNLAMVMEIRDSDEDGAKPIPVICVNSLRFHRKVTKFLSNFPVHLR